MRTSKDGGAALVDPATPNGKAEKSAKGAATPASSNQGQKLHISMMLMGVTPLLLDPMNDETLDILRGRGKSEKDNTLTKEQIASGKLYLGDNGEMVIPSANLLAALNHAGRIVPFDSKRGMASGDSSWIPAFLRFEQEYCPLMVGGRQATNDDWIADQRRGVLKANGAAVAIVRPKFKAWEVAVTVIFNPVGLPKPVLPATVKLLFELAGRASGLGSFRPSCKGPFGQFEVCDWQETVLEK